MSPKAKKTNAPKTGQAVALLIIDVQQGLFRRPKPIYKADELLDNICTLIERARGAVIPVIYIQHSNDSMLVYGSGDWQQHPRLQPREDEPIVHKQKGNAFEKTNLEVLLDERGVGRLVATGLVTHGCVRATCLGGIELGYQVTLVEDGHSNYHAKARQVIEEWNQKLDQAGIEVRPASKIVF